MSGSTTRNPRRWPAFLAGTFVLVLGFLCLNYTKAFDVDHHEEWAAGHGFPRPTYGIYLLGVALLAAGAGSLGWLIGRRRPSG